MNPPSNKLKKVELFLEMAIRKRASLRYREFFKAIKIEETDEEECDG